jgi:hypothetical protein
MASGLSDLAECVWIGENGHLHKPIVKVQTSRTTLYGNVNMYPHLLMEVPNLWPKAIK